MPSIYLKQTNKYHPFGESEITVTDEEYSGCKLFKKFKHTLNPSTNGAIWIYKGDHGFGNYLTIKPGSTHGSAKLTEAHVYYNQHDPEKTPLILVLIFENGVGTSPENKYYKWSQFKSKLNGESEEIKNLTTYANEKSILDALITENDQLENILTYNIGKIKGDNGDGTYNNNKICVKEDSSGEPTLSPGFKKYKHTPQPPHSSKKACVIYDGNVLLKQGNSELRGIQDKPYDHIIVYWSEKVAEPLLLELNEKDSSSNISNKYFYHTWKNGNGNDRSLYWKEIQQGKKVLDVTFDSGSTDVHTALIGSGGSKLMEVVRVIETHLQKTIISVSKICKFIENISTINLDC